MLQYRRAIEGLPRPTSAQIDAFVAYVFTAHSWYKHLPHYLPGVPFTFYVDPAAGYRLDARGGGDIGLVERREGERFFHYNEVPTRQYLERFGHLAYSTGSGSRVALRRGGDLQQPELAGSGSRPRVGIPGSKPSLLAVPPEVCAAGTVEFTAAIHKAADGPWMWELSGPRILERSWPEESGGRATLARLAETMEEARKDQDALYEASMTLNLEPWTGRPRHRFDLHEVIGPERERQRTNAVRAIDAMLDLLYGQVAEKG